jgi:hypothetical protein
VWIPPPPQVGADSTVTEEISEAEGAHEDRSTGRPLSDGECARPPTPAHAPDSSVRGALLLPTSSIRPAGGLHPNQQSRDLIFGNPPLTRPGTGQLRFFAPARRVERARSPAVQDAGSRRSTPGIGQLLREPRKPRNGTHVALSLVPQEDAASLPLRFPEDERT